MNDIFIKASLVADQKQRYEKITAMLEKLSQPSIAVIFSYLCYVPVHKVNKDVYVSLFNPEVKITLGKSISNSDTSVYLDRNIIPADKNAIILEGEYEGIPRKLPLNMYVVNKVKLIKEC